MNRDDAPFASLVRAEIVDLLVPRELFVAAVAQPHLQDACELKRCRPSALLPLSCVLKLVAQHPADCSLVDPGPAHDPRPVQFPVQFFGVARPEVLGERPRDQRSGRAEHRFRQKDAGRLIERHQQDGVGLDVSVLERLVSCLLYVHSKHRGHASRV
jgi:hypothetical protein